MSCSKVKREKEGKNMKAKAIETKVREKSHKHARWLKKFQFTIDDLEVTLSAGRTKIREWINDGLLHAYKIPGCDTVYCAFPDVVEFIEKYRGRIVVDGQTYLELTTKE